MNMSRLYQYCILTAIFVLVSCTILPAHDSRLHYAAHSGALDIIRTELAAGADVNSHSMSRWTPLHAAASAGYFDIVKYLLRHGANVDIRADGGWTADQEAEFVGNYEIAAYLKAVRKKQDTVHFSLITNFDTLTFSRRYNRKYSQWHTKYPLPHRQFWSNPLQVIDIYIQHTVSQYLAAFDYQTSIPNIRQADVTLLQNEFESDQAFANRRSNIEFQIYDRRLNVDKTRKLLIADSLQWTLRSFRLENPSFNQKNSTVEVDVVANGARFQERVQAIVDNAALAKSFVNNPQQSSLDVYMRVNPTMYQIKQVLIYHQGFLLNALPLLPTTYLIAKF